MDVSYTPNTSDAGLKKAVVATMGGHPNTHLVEMYKLQDPLKGPRISRPAGMAAATMGAIGGIVGATFGAIATTAVQGVRRIVFNHRVMTRRVKALEDIVSIDTAIRANSQEKVINAFKQAFQTLGTVHLPARGHHEFVVGIMNRDGEMMNLFIRMFMYARSMNMSPRDMARVFAPAVYSSQPRLFTKEREVLAQMYGTWVEVHPSRTRVYG